MSARRPWKLYLLAIRELRQVRTEGNRQVARTLPFYKLYLKNSHAKAGLEHGATNAALLPATLARVFACGAAT